MLDFEVQRCTRKCAVSGRVFAPGETFYSVLQPDGGAIVRVDFDEASWSGPPQESLGWWKSSMPGRDGNKVSWAPNDVMLDLFLQWSGDAHREDIRYILALLLIRRRVFRFADTSNDVEAGGVLTVDCPRRNETYTVKVAIPDAARTESIQDELAQLLLSRAA